MCSCREGEELWKTHAHNEATRKCGCKIFRLLFSPPTQVHFFISNSNSERFCIYSSSSFHLLPTTTATTPTTHSFTLCFLSGWAKKWRLPGFSSFLVHCWPRNIYQMVSCEKEASFSFRVEFELVKSIIFK